ncbi:MAG: DUF4330 family protein [Bacilli bacterium]
MKNINWIDILIIICIIIIAIITPKTISNFKKKYENPKNLSEQNIILTVVVDGLWMETKFNLKEGDYVNNINSQHKGKIINYKFKSSPMLLTNINGDIIGVTSLKKQKIVLKIEANVLTTGSYIAFNGQEIKVGLPFITKTNSLELTGKIQYIEVA